MKKKDNDILSYMEAWSLCSLIQWRIKSSLWVILRKPMLSIDILIRNQESIETWDIKSRIVNVD